MNYAPYTIVQSSRSHVESSSGAVTDAASTRHRRHDYHRSSTCLPCCMLPACPQVLQTSCENLACREGWRRGATVHCSCTVKAAAEAIMGETTTWRHVLQIHSQSGDEARLALGAEVAGRCTHATFPWLQGRHCNQELNVGLGVWKNVCRMQVRPGHRELARTWQLHGWAQFPCCDSNSFIGLQC